MRLYLPELKAHILSKLKQLIIKYFLKIKKNKKKKHNRIQFFCFLLSDAYSKN